MKVNTNSNVYIVIYSVVMVVIVATVLAVAAISLKPRQEANERNEKQQQIVTALGYDAETTPYAEVIEGEVALPAGTIYKAKDGSVVVPLMGAGLWGPIWGYIALEPDMNTVKGVVFAHKGETPGLGAEITTEKHQKMYVGKTVYEGNELVGVTLVKGGAKASSPMYSHEVDAITGGTKTSDGVSAMIKDCLTAYKTYFDEVRAAAEAKSNELNTENNEQ